MMLSGAQNAYAATVKTGQPRSVASITAMMILASLILLLPAFFNGRPFLFYDSQQYFMIGRSLLKPFVRSTDPPFVSFSSKAKHSPLAPAKDTGGTASSEGGGLAAIAGGRSPIYSVLVYIVSAKLTMWLLVWMQALTIGWLIVRFLQFAAPTLTTAHVLAAVGALTWLFSLGFIVNFVMPDIFAAVFVLAATRLAAERNLYRGEIVGLTGLMSLSTVMHTSILALAILFLFAVIIASRLTLPVASLTTRVVPAILAAIVCGEAVAVGYGWAVEKVSGKAVRAPPYLMARVIADGPGAKYLKDQCTSVIGTFVVCRFAGYTYKDNNDFLWGTGGAKMTYSTASLEGKLALTKEEMRFVVAVVGRYPFEQLSASLGNVAQQFAATDLGEIENGAETLRHVGWDDVSILDVTPDFFHCMQTNDPCPASTSLRRIWSELVKIGSLLALVLLVLVVAALVVTMRERKDSFADSHERGLLLIGFLFIFALGANAAVCGALSGPTSRYQTRLTWLAPLFLIAARRPIAEIGLRLKPDAQATLATCRTGSEAEDRRA